jgi:uncharacterized protein YbjT (DUF2867 family)
MDVRTILVTAATGKTGGATIPILLRQGYSVRAFVHRLDARAEALAVAGAEIVFGDLLDFGAVAAALEGIDTAYFCYPIAPGLVEASAYFAEAARAAGVRGIVNMSQISARREALSDAARQHWICERLFERSGVAVTHLRPTFFAEWLLLVAPFIARDGEIPLPLGRGRHAPIAAADQARVIAAILADPAAHAGQIYALFGPVEMNYDEIAAEVGRVLDRPVRYRPIEIAEFARMVEARFGGAPHLVQHLSNVAIDYRDGRFAGTNDVVRRIGGMEPATVGDFVTTHRAAFVGAIG